jgi:hypothetical protein
MKKPVTEIARVDMLMQRAVDEEMNPLRRLQGLLEDALRWIGPSHHRDRCAIRKGRDCTCGKERLISELIVTIKGDGPYHFAPALDSSPQNERWYDEALPAILRAYALDFERPTFRLAADEDFPAFLRRVANVLAKAQGDSHAQ